MIIYEVCEMQGGIYNVIRTKHHRPTDVIGTCLTHSEAVELAVTHALEEADGKRNYGQGAREVGEGRYGSRVTLAALIRQDRGGC